MPAPSLLALLATLLAGCGAARPPEQLAPPVSAVAAAVSLPGTITFQGDVAPIDTLAYADGFLWIGSARGLRRVRASGGPAEWVGTDVGMVGKAVSALATDRDGHLMIATDAEVGRLSGLDGHTHYQTVAKLPHVTHLAPALAPAAGDGIWAGTATGLFFVRRGKDAGNDGGKITPIETPRGLAITSLDVESDGKSAWAGVATQGVFHVDAQRVIDAFGPQAPSHIDFADTVGTALLPNGTRVAVGRGVNGATRLLLLRVSGPEILTAERELSALALVKQSAIAGGAGQSIGPWLVAGPSTAPALYQLDAGERGQLVEAGAFRFAPARKNLQGERIVARPDPRRVPLDITAAISLAGPERGTGDQIFAGTRSQGVARLASGGPDYLPGGELALGARGLSVACLEQERCVFATGAGPGWIWDGGNHSIKPIPDEAIGGGLMALAGDGRSTVYFVAAGGGKSLRIARLSSDGASWDPFLTLPVQVDGVPLVTFAALSPGGNMWMAVRDRAASGQESGRGVIELVLPAGRWIHHRPYREHEPRSPEAIPVAGDVAAIRFAKGAGPADPETTWFCTSLGIQRFAGGQFSHWGESDGLDSELCHDLEITADGIVWAATAKGVVRFDGREWRRLGSTGGSATAVASPGPRLERNAATGSRWPVDRDGDATAATALVVSGQTLWAGTQHGLWPVSAPGNPIDRRTGLIDDSIQHLVPDRFGRVWIMGQVGLTIRRPF